MEFNFRFDFRDEHRDEYRDMLYLILMLFDVSYRRILAVGRSSVPSSVDLGQESSGAMVSADSFSKKVDLRVQRGGNC